MKRHFLIGMRMILCMMLLAFILPASAEAAICKHTYEDTICTECGQIGGTCGTNATWSFEPKTGVLKIDGSGTMDNYSVDVPAPWFLYKDEIKEVSFVGAVSSIGKYAFYECTEITTIYISKSINNIYTQSFYKCDSLEEFVVDENGNYSLDDKGVLYNKKYTYLIALPGVFEGVFEIPKTVTTVGPGTSSEPNVFAYIKGVTEIHVDPENTNYSSTEEGLLFNKKQTQLIACPKSYAGDCTLPATMTSYYSDAFTDCYGLTGIFVEEGNTKYSSTASGVLCNQSGKTVILCPAGFKGTCVIPAKVTSCPVSAFSQSVGLEKFEVEAGNSKYSSDEAGMLYNKAVTQLLICPNAYQGRCKLPATVTSVASDAFKYAPGMTGYEVSEENTGYTVDEYGVLYNKDKSALISCPPVFQGAYVVPDSVVTLGNYAFYYCSGLTEITLPDTVTTIGDYCFYQCANLANVPLPSGLKKIGTHAFAHCPNQIDADIPATVTSIGSYAFAYCPSIINATIPEGITSLAGVFMHCPNMVSVELPSTLKTLGAYTFYECSELTKINVPDTVTMIDDYCFYLCSKMANVPLPSGLKKIGTHAFAHCSNQADANLPATVTDLGTYAFAYCLEIVSASVPEGITSLTGVFMHCPNMVSVELPDTLTTLGKGTFYECYALSEINIPDTVTTIRESCFQSCENLSDIPIPSGLTELGDSAFAYCSSLKTATIPQGIQTLNEYIFRDCTSLEEVSIPDSVTEIGEGCFYQCSNLVKADIPAAVTKIGKSAFYKCAKLENIRIPDNLEELGSSAFAYCDQLMEVEIPERVTRIENSTFHECDNLVKVTLHDNIIYIGSKAFYDCKKLQTFPLPANLEEIGTYAFWFCSQFEEFVIPESVKKIGESAFRYIENLKRIVVPGTIESLGGYLFYGSEKLTDVTIGEGLAQISNYMFYSCKSLEEVKIPESVTSIGVCAFKYCESLPEITIPDQVTSIGMLAFEDCTALKSVKLPAALNTMGESAFRNTGLEKVEFPAGMTMINVLTYANCPDLKIVEIPASVTAIMDAAFMNSGVTDVIYHGTKEQWKRIFIGAENGVIEKALMHYDPLDQDPHEITVEERMSSCTVNGGTYRICTCGLEVKQSETPATGHKMGEATCATAATCQNGCGLTEGEALGHIYEEPVFIWAENGAAASAEFTCTVCDTEENGHTMTLDAEIEEIDSTKGDCKTKASITYKASVKYVEEAYEDTKTFEGVVGDHSYQVHVVAATCEEPGGRYDVCEVCGNKQTLSEEQALGHDLEAATCTMPAKCKRQGCVYTEGEAQGHIFDSIASEIQATPADCDHVATYYIRCDNCSEVSDKLTVPVGKAKGHQFYEKVSKEIASEPSCTISARYYVQCDNCDKVTTDKTVAVGEANGHSFTTKDSDVVKVPATCETKAVHKVKCDNCDEISDEVTIEVGEPIGHDMEEATCVQPSTCKNDCGKTEGEALGHKWEIESTTNGKLTYVCTTCGDKKEEKDPNVQKPQFKDVQADAYYAYAVQWAVENGITNGYGSATTFCPDIECTRGQVVTFLWRAAGSPEPSSLNNPFTDVTSDAYYYKAVLWAVENGITAGYGSDTIFNPDGVCNRAQVATFMWRTFGKPEVSGIANRFTDIVEDAYYFEAVLWAVDYGITNGYGSDTIFNPDGNCTCGQIVTFLYRGMK